MKYYKTKDSHMAVIKVNDVEFCTHITANGVNWVLFSLVNHNAVECEQIEVLDAWIAFSNNIIFNRL